MKFLLISSILLIFMGCGGGDNSTSKIATDNNNKSIKMPTNISVSIPNILLNEQESTREDFQKISKQINQNTKIYTSNFKQKVKNIKEDIFLIQIFLDKIIKECQETSLNQICAIPKDTIFYQFNQTTIDKLLEKGLLLDELSLKDKLLNKNIYLGEIEFIKKEDTNEYNYSLTVDITTLYQLLFNEVPSTITIKWSKDENLFYYSLIQKLNAVHLEYRYINRPLVNREASLKSTFFYQPDSIYANLLLSHKEYFNSDLLYTKEAIENQLIEVEQQKAIRTFFDKLKLTKKGGIHLFNKEDSLNEEINNKYRENKLFDSNGTILSITYCNAKDECNIYDIQTWKNYLDYNQFKNLIKDNNLYQDLKIEKINNLKDGIYYILPPILKKEDINLNQVSQIRIGEFIIFKGNSYGLLKNRDYIDKLDKLQIVYLTDSNPNQEFFVKNRKESLKLIDRDNMPKLSLIEGI